MARRRGDGPGTERRTVVRAARQERWDALVGSGRLAYPDSLPITARRDDLLAAIRDHQVVVVAGETGSGKSTQLPKLCLELGRGVEGLIGHTQPRRVAARTIAERVADELGSTIGGDVAYSVRFDDQVRDGTLVRVMTDGILLAELHRDRELRRYDTLIIDEAHERSLNVDFILGYLRQLLPRRPDLKVIVTSATIDTARFARHFARDGVDAPVVEVTGRTYPVEVRYRPYGVEVETTDGVTVDRRDQVQAISDACDELAGIGDTLVFLSGEREIHDTADFLRRRNLHDTEVLPLYARLSAQEQHRIFQPHRGRRIVLATNVAETSITVPGVRTVIDTGTARISRYSRRLKVQRLPIESVSQASADQRAGRCGRVAPGVCIRLYSEEDYDSRAEFTEPEILRTNLASVILQMTAIGLGDVGSFPFVEPPDHSSIRDGYLLLEELGAIEAPDDRGERGLTPIGRRLARLPVDPRLGRMILESARNHCAREVLVIAAALSIRDPRERPEDQLDQANAAHKRFDVPGSDLLTIVALWDHLRTQQRALSGNAFRRLCRAEYLNYLRVREWQDLFSQLRHAAGDLGIRGENEPGQPDRIHRAVLAGLLSHIGMRDGDSRELKGARGSTFTIARGSVLTRRAPRWVMAAELVETNRLWARRVAGIEPAWAEQLGAHLVRRSYGEARWDPKRATAVTAETVTLYGLPIVSGRTVQVDRVDRRLAREMFIRFGLVGREWSAPHHSFLTRNAAFRERVGELEARVRRGPLLDDEELIDFYDERLPVDVTSGRRFDTWWKDVGDPHLLDLTDDVLGRRIGFRLADFPDTWRQGDLVLPLSYRFDPGGPLDGVAVHVPLTALNRVSDDGLDWQILGHRRELVDTLMRTLPKDVRRDLIPMAETVDKVVAVLGAPSGPLVDALAGAVDEVAGIRVRPAMFDRSVIPPYLRMNVIVTGPDGEVVDADNDLAAIKRRLASTAREAIAAAAPIDERRGMVTWDVGTLPQEVSAEQAGIAATGYPALLDDGSSVSLRVLTNADLQQRVMRGGVRRLFLLSVAPPARDVLKGLTRPGRLAIAAAGVDLDGLVGDCATAAVDTVLDARTLPWDADAFAALQRDVRQEAPGIAAGAMARAGDALVEATAVRERLARLVAPALQPSVADATAQLDRLVRPGFVRRAGTARIDDIARYVRAIGYRLDRLASDVGRDRRRMADIVPLEDEYAALVQRGATGAAVVELGWRLEELRVSTFAQPIGTKGSVSTIKLRRELAALGA